MRKIRDVLRLRLGNGLSQRAIARSLGVSQAAVCEYLDRFHRSGLAWPLLTELDDEQLEARLFPPPPALPSDQRPLPDWAWVHWELRRPNVTLALVWEEYRAAAPEGFGYSWFCDLYRGGAGRLKPTLRQVHRAGERMFVDFAGSTVAWWTGQAGRSGRRRSSWPCSGRQASPTPALSGVRRCRTGLAATSVPSPTSAA